MREKGLAKVVGEGGKFYVVSSGRLRCASCGSVEFRALVDGGMEPHLFCARCGCEYVIGNPPSWRFFLEEEGEEE
jgi:transcription initiation factor TFIIIB Brf1 subunit/transcription initiation factor TFIIB